MKSRHRSTARRASEALDVTAFGMTGLLFRAGLVAITGVLLFLIYLLCLA